MNMNTFLKNLLIISCILLCSIPKITNAQEKECGTELLPEQINYMNETRFLRSLMDMSQFDDDDEEVNISIVAHIIRDDNGNNGLSIADLQSAINDLNNTYQPVSFTFHICSINFIDDDQYANEVLEYGDNRNTPEYQMALPYLAVDAIDIFFLPNLGRYCGWASFPSYLNTNGKDWLVMDNGCANNGSTLAHEMGHYFNLYHTHQGTSSSLNVIGNELVDGSNCGSNVGDELCDTPADPNISALVDINCNYVGQERDSNNDLYMPDPENVMAYNRYKYCRTQFSPKQIERIRQSYIFDRNYLNETVCTYICLDETACNFGEPELCKYGNFLCSDPCNPSTCPDIFVFPELITIPVIPEIPDFCPWCPVCLTCPPYELDHLINPELGPVVNPGLGPEINPGLSPNLNFGIGGPKLADTDSGALAANSFTVFPNPTNGKVTITLDNESTEPHTITVFNLSGKEIQQNSFTNNRANLDLSHIAKGMYMIKIQNDQTKNSLSTQKLLVK